MSEKSIYIFGKLRFWAPQKEVVLIRLTSLSSLKLKPTYIKASLVLNPFTPEGPEINNLFFDFLQLKEKKITPFKLPLFTE